MKAACFAAALSFLASGACAAGFVQPEKLAALAAAGWPGAPEPSPAVPYRGAPAARDGAAVSGWLSVWSQDCSGAACGLPQAIAPARSVKFDLPLPVSAGEARFKTVTEEFDLPGLGRLAAKLSFYAVCPYGSSEGCPARYFQAQAELSGPAAAFCAASLNAADFMPFPVLLCAGHARPGIRLGVTLHRQPL